MPHSEEREDCADFSRNESSRGSAAVGHTLPTLPPEAPAAPLPAAAKHTDVERLWWTKTSLSSQTLPAGSRHSGHRRKQAGGVGRAFLGFPGDQWAWPGEQVGLAALVVGEQPLQGQQGPRVKTSETGNKKEGLPREASAGAGRDSTARPESAQRALVCSRRWPPFIHSP